MHSLLDLARAHGSLLVFAFSFLENAGLPVPALPVLVLAGCLMVEGPVSLPLTLLAATVGALIADLSWYFFGRAKGRATLISSASSLSIPIRVSDAPSASSGLAPPLRY